jgi:hypothetical protein
MLAAVRQQPNHRGDQEHNLIHYQLRGRLDFPNLTDLQAHHLKTARPNLKVLTGQ